MLQPSAHGAYGYGWEMSERVISEHHDTLQIISHSGSINGFGSYMARIESDSILVIVLKNSRTDSYISPAYAPVIGQEIISILYGEKAGIPVRSLMVLPGVHGSFIGEVCSVKKGSRIPELTIAVVEEFLMEE